MKGLIKGILYRMIHDKVFAILTLVITPILIFLSIFFSTNASIKGSIALVNMDDVKVESNDVKVTYINEKPKKSELVSDKYDAYVYMEDGKAKVETVKGDEFKNTIESAIKGEAVSENKNDKRGVCTDLIGYLCLFVMIQGIALYKFFYDEKGGTVKRILSSNISNPQYMLGHLICTFIMIYVPLEIITMISYKLFNFNTTITMGQLSLGLFGLSIIAVSFGGIFAAIFENDEQSIMIGELFIFGTTLASGCIFKVSSNKFVDVVSAITPQKYVFKFMQNLENGTGFDWKPMAIVIAICVVLFAAAVIINTKRIKSANC